MVRGQKLLHGEVMPCRFIGSEGFKFHGVIERLQGVTIQCLILVVSTELEILNLTVGSNIAQTAVIEGDFEWSNFWKEQAAEKDSE